MELIAWRCVFVPIMRPLPPSSVLLLMAVLSTVTAVGEAAFAQSGGHGDGHAQGHDLYQRWSPPNNPNTSCCNNGDCRPTRAYVDNEGRWRAWNGKTWLIVPQERVLPPDFAGDGRSHLCEKEQFIYCFTPGEVRS
jgi:hypothetical protein